MEQVNNKIIAAIKTVREKVRHLKKDDFNAHGKYRYVSIDTYYEKVVPVASEAGLVWVGRELEWGSFTHNDKTYVKVIYGFDLYTVDAVAKDFTRVTVTGPLTGPQTTGQLYSYADKVFMRGTFGIATGETDGDSVVPEDSRPSLPTGAPSSSTPVKRFAAGDVPEGVDPITGEVMSPKDDPATAKPLDMTPSQSKDGYPIVDTRKLTDRAAAEMVYAVFETWMPKIKSRGQLVDWRAENVAAIEKVAKIDPEIRERISGLFRERNEVLKLKESGNV